MRLIDSGGLPCPDCGSPLKPCKCERGDTRRRVPGSKLMARPGKLRSRGVMEKYKDDPFLYGVLFTLVRTWRCFGATYLPGHECGLGYAPPTAHHPGKTDLDGLLPVCGALHDLVEERPSRVERALREAGQPSLHDIARTYLSQASQALVDLGELPAEVEAVCRRKGLL